MENITQADTGKRKRSPVDSLVNAPIPFSSNDLSHSVIGSSTSPAETLPLPKRARLPEKPPVPDPGSASISSLASLPPGVLQAIFSELDPSSLARLMRVNRTFRDLLDARRQLLRDEAINLSNDGPRYHRNPAPLLSQDGIWQRSRRRYAASMPQPLKDLAECELFALSFGITCQFCGVLPTPVSDPSGTWCPVPAEYSVRVLWSFKVRSCVPCLAPLLKKDFEVMISEASPLRPALSFAFFTPSLQYVPQSRWREAVPHDIDLQKYYYTPEIELMQEEAKSVQLLGQAAAEEWVKGLPSRGQSNQRSATQWEEWELNGGLEETRRSLFQSSEVPRTPPASVGRDVRHLPSSMLGTSTFVMPRPSSLPLVPFPNMLPPLPAQLYGLAPGLEAPPGLPPKPSDASSMGSQASSHTLRTAPSSSERARIRAHKRSQILERCRVLNPPIHIDMLERLDAFSSALQIPMPLSDSSWGTLKSLLLMQRNQIELQDEARNSVKTAPVPGQFIAPPRTDEYVLAHADTPIKDKLCEIAKEYIKQRFGHGGWVTYPTAPQFAAKVLVHTRERYLEERARIKALRSHDVSPPQDDIITYEHMKSVFEQTIRPQTEQIRKDLFLCSSCPIGGAIKYFAFESMVQHFAFKHDPNFTSEAPKAFWKGEWPEVPPFNIHPERVHTPEPSVVQTPTLSHLPQSIMSPVSNVHTMIPPRRRTPDTLSLLSGNTNPFSASGQSTRKFSQIANPGPPVMYELQRDSLAIELNRGWKLTRGVPDLPLNLQLYLTLGFAVASFSRKYKNEPSLNMLEDCIGVKNELRELKNLEPVRCAECVLDGREEVQVQWSLQDLIAHFRKMHVENSTNKAYWKDSMISLPAPAFIKGLLANDEIPTVLQNLLQDAETTAVIQKATANPSKSQSVGQYESKQDSRQTQASQAGRSVPVDMDGRPYSQHFGQAREPQSYHGGPPFSTRANYDDLSSARDSNSTSLRPLNARDYPVVAPDRSVNTSQTDFSTYSTTLQSSNRSVASMDAHYVPPSREIVEARGEAMSRSETIHSHRSRGENAIHNTAEDFLNTIDAHLDDEMAGSDLGGSRSSHLSHPVSRTNSARGPGSRVSHRTSLNHGDEGEQRRLSESSGAVRYQLASQPSTRRDDYLGSASLVDGGEPQTMERQRSRVIEFDRQGNPLPTDGRVYQEPPSLRSNLHRQYVDEFDRSLEPISHPYDHGFGVTTQSTAGMDFMEGYPSRKSYEALRREPALAYRPERIVDSVTGQVYVAERPSMRRFDDTEDPKPLFDDVGRHVRYEYREVDYDPHMVESPRYERQTSEYQDRRYQGR